MIVWKFEISAYLGELHNLALFLQVDLILMHVVLVPKAGLGSICMHGGLPH